MTSPNAGDPDDKLIRADRRGRLLVRAEQRAAILEASDESSLSAMAFCRQHGLSYSTFATWIQKRRRELAPERGDPAVQAPAFAEVVIDEGKTIPKTSKRGPSTVRRSLDEAGRGWRISDTYRSRDGIDQRGPGRAAAVTGIAIAGIAQARRSP